MSFARLGCDGSQVYVYDDMRGGYTCCFCSLNKGGQSRFADKDGIIKHLFAHREAGDTVPEYTFEDIREYQEGLDLSKVLSVNVVYGEPVALTEYGFIENALRMLPHSRSDDEVSAFKYLRGLGFTARRKARRLRLWATAQMIAERVGHGEVAEPMRIFPDQAVVSLECFEDAKKLFGGAHEDRDQS